MDLTIGCAVAAEYIRHFRPHAGHRSETQKYLAVPTLVRWALDAVAGRRADLTGSEAQVPGRGRKAAMAKQELNGPQIGGAGFEEMHSECVPKRMRRDGFRGTG